MIKPIITVSLLAAAMILTTFGSHLIVNPIQAKTSTHDNSKHDNSKHDNSKPDNSSQTIKVSCSDLAGVLAALNQAHCIV